MFRLNLYPEAEAKRRARLARTGSTALVTFLAAAILVLTAFHAGSGLLLAERAKELDAKSIERQTEIHAMPTHQTSAELGTYREYLKERTDRVVLAPKFAELGRSVRWPLAVTTVGYSERGRGQTGAALRIEGIVPADRAREADALIGALVESLRKNAAFMEGLSDVDLASVSLDQQSKATNFQIACPVLGGAPGEEGVEEESMAVRPEHRERRP